MEENSLYIYPTIAICIEDIDRLIDKEYKFTIPSINFNKSSSSEEKEEMKNQGITNIINNENISINKIEINNYFMIYIPKEVMSTTYTSVGVSGTLFGDSGYNYSSLNFESFNGNNGSADTDITVSETPETISSFILSLLKLGNGIIKGIKQTFDSFKLSIRSSGPNNGIDIIPNDRYIKKGSQWVVMFIDGDPSKPTIIARYR